MYSDVGSAEMITVLLYSTFLFLLTIDVAESCSCFPAHHQRAYCDADYAIKAKVISTGHPYDQEFMYYKISISKIFKGKENIMEIQSLAATSNGPCREGNICIKTSILGSMCGVRLHFGVEYLFIGYVHDDNTLSYGICDLGSRWEDLSDLEIKLIDEGYDCSCSVVSCFVKYNGKGYICPDDVKGKSKCISYGQTHKLSGKDNDCKCQKGRHNRCVWSANYCNGYFAPKIVNGR